MFAVQPIRQHYIQIALIATMRIRIVQIMTVANKSYSAKVANHFFWGYDNTTFNKPFPYGLQ